jgi:hypothetical protein
MGKLQSASRNRILWHGKSPGFIHGGLSIETVIYNARMSLYVPVFEALNGMQVRYVVVGGLATVLHGYARLTADIDLMVDLEPE